MRVLFVADDRQESGLGHVVRSGALRDEMIERGHETYWCAWWEMPNPAIQYDAVVYDGYWDDERDILGVIEAWREAQPGALKVYISDDPRQYQPFDLVVNGGAGANDGQYYETGAGSLMTGPMYALLRKEFRDQKDAAGPRWGRIDARKMQGLVPIIAAMAMRDAAEVITDGGMKTLEALCVGARPIVDLPPGASYGQDANAEAVNYGGPIEVDGLGCSRVADAIERMIGK